MKAPQIIKAQGKLLLTGEYVVLDGALACALPTKKGQSFSIISNASNQLYWQSFLENGTRWLEARFDLPLRSGQTFDDPIVTTLYDILLATQKLRPSFLNTAAGHDINARLEFPRDWGLGSSSTLIAAIAQWAQIDAHKLLEKTFGGSGYDLDCAFAKGPITYQITTAGPVSHDVHFDPPFKESLFFVHLNKKQNSRDSIKHYRAQAPAYLHQVITKISDITRSILKCTLLEQFEALLISHEHHLEALIKTERIQTQYFKDYNGGVVKSLGGWGGDFVLVTGTQKTVESYFKSKGYRTIIPYKEMIL